MERKATVHVLGGRSRRISASWGEVFYLRSQSKTWTRPDREGINLCQLPLELVANILGYSDDRKAVLHALCLVDGAHRQHFERLLYSHVIISTLAARDCLVRTLRSSPAKAQLVERLEFARRPPRMRGKVLGSRNDAEAGRLNEVVSKDGDAALVLLLPNLRSLSADCRRSQQKTWQSIQGLLDSPRTREWALGSLEELSISGLARDEPVQLHDILRLPRLNILRLDSCRLCLSHRGGRGSSTSSSTSTSPSGPLLAPGRSLTLSSCDVDLAAARVLLNERAFGTVRVLDAYRQKYPEPGVSLGGPAQVARELAASRSAASGVLRNLVLWDAKFWGASAVDLTPLASLVYLEIQAWNLYGRTFHPKGDSGTPASAVVTIDGDSVPFRLPPNLHVLVLGVSYAPADWDAFLAFLSFIAHRKAEAAPQLRTIVWHATGSCYLFNILSARVVDELRAAAIGISVLPFAKIRLDDTDSVVWARDTISLFSSA